LYNEPCSVRFWTKEETYLLWERLAMCHDLIEEVFSLWPHGTLGIESIFHLLEWLHGL